jgi:hypothetical protein
MKLTRPNRIVGCLTLMLLLLPMSAGATPGRGYDCAGCHGSSAAQPYNDSRLTLLGFDTTANPVERAGAADRGTLPVYQVFAGQHEVVSLLTSGLPATTKYGVFTDGFQTPGVVNGLAMDVTPDAGWVSRSAGAWFTRSSFSTGTTYTIDFLVPATAGADYYEYELGWGGDVGSDGGFKRFYVQVFVPEPAWAVSMTATAALSLVRRRRARPV